MFESITLEIELNPNKRIIVTNIYRPNSPINGMTSSNQLNEFLEIMSNLQHNLQNRNCDSFIFSDQNLDLLKFEQHEKTNTFLENCFAFGYLPVITRPSRITNQSATCIDNIMTNCINNSYKSGIILNSASDHFPVYFITNFPSK